MEASDFAALSVALPGQPPFAQLERPVLQDSIRTGAEESAIVFLRQGLLSLNLQKGSIYVLAKDILIIPPGQELLVASFFKETNLYLLRIHNARLESALAQQRIPAFFGRDRSAAGSPDSDHFRLYGQPQAATLYHALELVVQDFLLFPDNKANLILLDFFRFLVYLHGFPDGAFRPLATVDAMDKVLWTLKFIRENYPTASLAQVAEELHYRPDYLSSLLKRATGKSFSALLRKRRMIVATDLLTRTELSLQEIALRTGYQDYSGFYRAFLQEFGISPRQYRLENI